MGKIRFVGKVQMGTEKQNITSPRLRFVKNVAVLGSEVPRQALTFFKRLLEYFCFSVPICTLPTKRLFSREKWRNEERGDLCLGVGIDGKFFFVFHFGFYFFLHFPAEVIADLSILGVGQGIAQFKVV